MSARIHFGLLKVHNKIVTLLAELSEEDAALVLIDLASRYFGLRLVRAEPKRRAVGRMREPHVDHVIPYSRGGKTEIGNLRATHAHCNIAKGARLQ